MEKIEGILLQSPLVEQVMLARKSSLLYMTEQKRRSWSKCYSAL